MYSSFNEECYEDLKDRFCHRSLLRIKRFRGHDIELSGAGKVAETDHLPPTVSVQYHFMPDSNFRPYVGAGINYTDISDVNLRSTIAGVNLELDQDSVGGALQAGFDYKIANNVFLNFDVKKIYIDSDVKINGTKVSRVKLDPLAIGIGIGYRF